MSKDTITIFNITGDSVTDFGDELSSISPIPSDEEYTSPIFDRNDSGQLNAPIKKNRPYRIIKKELKPVKKNLGHIFNFILDNLEKGQKSQDEYSDVEEELSDNESEYSFDPYFDNYDSDGEPDESNDWVDYGMMYRPKSP